MSLIQEALKRQQAEFGDGASKPSPTPPAMPDAAAPAAMPAVENPPPPRPSVPLPEAPLPEQPVAPARAAPRPWLSFLGVVLLGVLFIGAASWLVVFAWQHFTFKPAPVDDVAVIETPVVEAASAPTPEKHPVAPPAAEKTPPPAPEAASEPDNPVKTGLTEAEMPSSAPPPPSAIEEASQARPAPVEKAAVVPARPAPEKRSVSPPAAKKSPPPAPVVWPMLRLTGVLCSAVPGEGAARINNAMIFVGSRVDGVTLLKIQEDGVLLRHQNETRFLRVGATMY